MKHQKRMISLIAAGSLALLSACGSADANDSAESEDSNEMVDLTVAAMAISNTAPIRVGQEQGFFEEEGINLTVTEAQGGADIPGVVSGEFEFAFGNLMSVFVAREQGLELEFVVNAASATTEVEADTGAVIVSKDSDIESAADLEGKTVSVNNLANIGDTTIRMIVDEAGGDSSTIKFTEVDFPNAAQAVDLGQVDAAWVTEPFITLAEKDNSKVLFYNFKEAHPNLDVAGYFTSSEYAQENPEIVERFQAAMEKSHEYSKQNDQEVRDMIATYTEIDDETLQEIVLPDFRAEFDRDAVTALTDAAVEHGTMDEAPDLDALLP